MNPYYKGLLSLLTSLMGLLYQFNTLVDLVDFVDVYKETKVNKLVGG
jgi:hypothetical protein